MEASKIRIGHLYAPRPEMKSPALTVNNPFGPYYATRHTRTFSQLLCEQVSGIVWKISNNLLIAVVHGKYVGGKSIDFNHLTNLHLCADNVYEINIV